MKYKKVTLLPEDLQDNIKDIQLFLDQYPQYQDCVLVGSTALRINVALLGKDHTRVKESDFDFIYPHKHGQPAHERFDFISASPIYKTIISSGGFYDFDGPRVADLDTLYTLKISHTEWSRNNKELVKHIQYITMMKSARAKLTDDWEVFYKYWKDKFKTHVNLDKNKNDFFTSGVKRYVDHDSLHASVALFGEPMFTRILKDGSEVLTDKNKFFQLPKEHQFALAVEEATVLSLERKLLGLDHVPYPREIEEEYHRQLLFIISRYATGWFPAFIMDNFAELTAFLREDPYKMLDVFGQNLNKLIPGEYWERAKGLWWYEKVIEQKEKSD